MKGISNSSHLDWFRDLSRSQASDFYSHILWCNFLAKYTAMTPSLHPTKNISTFKSHSFPFGIIVQNFGKNKIVLRIIRGELGPQ